MTSYEGNLDNVVLKTTALKETKIGDKITLLKITQVLQFSLGNRALDFCAVAILIKNKLQTFYLTVFFTAILH